MRHVCGICEWPVTIYLPRQNATQYHNSMLGNFGELSLMRSLKLTSFLTTGLSNFILTFDFLTLFLYISGTARQNVFVNHIIKLVYDMCNNA